MSLLKIMIFLTWYYVFLQFAQGVCYFDKYEIQEGKEAISDNCQKCTCIKNPMNPSKYCFQCEDACLIDQKIIAAVNKGRHSWKARGYHEFFGMTIDHAKMVKLGTCPPDNNSKLMFDVRKMNTDNDSLPSSCDERNNSVPSPCGEEMISISIDENFCSTHSSFDADNTPLPKFFDAREKWPNLIHPPQNQNEYGASWAFSATGVASDRLAIESNGTFKIALSPHHLIYYVADNSHCGHLDKAWTLMENNGTLSEGCFNYFRDRTSSAVLCYGDRNMTDCPRIHTLTYTKPAYRIPNNENDIMVEIMNNGPVQTLMKIKQDFFMYMSGIYRYSTTGGSGQSEIIGYHSVRIIGWGEETLENGDILTYWLCANSWGSHWGDGGYFRIERGQFEQFTVASSIHSVELINTQKVLRNTGNDIVDTLLATSTRYITRGRFQIPNFINERLTLKQNFELEKTLSCPRRPREENQTRNGLSPPPEGVVLKFISILFVYMMTCNTYII